MSKRHADEKEGDRNIYQAASWEEPKSPLIQDLLQKSASRAIHTLSTTTSANWDDFTEAEEANTKDTIQNVLDAAILRSSSAIDDKFTKTNIQPQSTNAGKISEPHQDKRTYLNNPAVTPTALAHSLWQSTIIPYQDTVIDATCGNGKDCLALIRMLFPEHKVNDEDTHSDNVHPHLIGIDIQSRAISNTKRSLLMSLPENIYFNHVTLLERSHENLVDIFEPREDGKTQQVGLVCYNLGYLPGGATDNYKETKTQTQTTLNSITDAVLLLRVGGLLSIMTYPASNLEESMAVEHFAEGLAMLTTRDDGGWRGYLEGIPDYSSNDITSENNAGSNNNGGRIRDLVSRSIERVAKEGEARQTWRAFVHKPLGRPLSPILVTAHRIK